MNVSADGNKQSDPKFAGGTGAAAYSIHDNSPSVDALDDPWRRLEPWAHFREMRAGKI